jgi:single-strand DNA-binding protein
MLNKWIGMGRLTADPTFSQTQSGVSVCKFTVAVNRNYKDANGEQQTDFINCVAWRTTAEFVSRYFSKGKMIIIEGSLQNNNYTDQNGVKHYGMNVNVENAQFGESKSSANNSQQTVQNNQNDAVGNLSGYEEIISDGGEIPF